MENNINLQSCVQHIKKSTKKTNKSSKKTKPIKVVYISNPMKIKTSASQFRALVQELTGRDSGFPDPAKFPVVSTEDGDSTAEIEGAGDLGLDDHTHQYNNLDRQVVMMSGQFEQSSESTNSSSTTNSVSPNANTNPYDVFDNDDVVFMMEGFSGISPSCVWYETPHQLV